MLNDQLHNDQSNDCNSIFILTLFPELFSAWQEFGILAQFFHSAGGKHFRPVIINLRDFGIGKRKTIDSKSIGGGEGMVIRPDILKNCLDFLNLSYRLNNSFYLFYLSPKGRIWTEKYAQLFFEKYFEQSETISDKKKFILPKRPLIFLCGRYEGIDVRFEQLFVHEYLSIGNFITTGGEIPLMAILESLWRRIPNFMNSAHSVMFDSFAQSQNGLLDYDHYCGPATFEGLNVPEILYCGHHEKIERYRKQKAYEITQKYRPDLLK